MSEHTPNDAGIEPALLSETAVVANAERLRAEISNPVGSVAIAPEMGQSDSLRLPESQAQTAERMKKAERAFFDSPDNLLKQIDEGELDVNDTDFEDRTAIMMMTAQGHTEAVRELIARNADVNRINMYQGRIPMSALDAARQTNRKDIEQLLLENGAKTGRELQAEQNAPQQPK